MRFYVCYKSGKTCNASSCDFWEAIITCRQLSKLGATKIKADGPEEAAGRPLSDLGVEYDAHWTICILTQWHRVGGRCLEELPGVLQEPQTNPAGYTAQAEGYTPHNAIWAFWISNKTHKWWSVPQLQHNKITPLQLLQRTAIHCLLQSFQLWPRTQKPHKSKPLAVRVTVVKRWIAPCTWDVWSIKSNLAEAYSSKQGKVPVISFIGASQTRSLGFTQRLMSGKINTSFTVPAETPWP